MIDCLTLREVALLLKVEDPRTVDDWCQRTGVKVFADRRPKYVLRLQVEYAILKPIIPIVKATFGSRWLAALQAYRHNDMMQLITLVESAVLMPTRPARTPRGDHETKFLLSLTNLLSEQKCEDGATTTKTTQRNNRVNHVL